MVVKMKEDWQEIDVVMEEDKEILGFWVDGEFLSLDNTLRYNTPWTGSAPECYTETDEKIAVSGFYSDYFYGYLIEINDASQEVRVWQQIA